MLEDPSTLNLSRYGTLDNPNPAASQTPNINMETNSEMLNLKDAKKKKKKKSKNKNKNNNDDITEMSIAV